MMTSERTRLRARMRAVVSLVCAGAFGLSLSCINADEAAAAKAKPKVSQVKQRPIPVIPIDVNRFAYTTHVEAKCRGKATPLMVGWSSPGGSIGHASPVSYGDETTFGMRLVAPARAGKFKATLSCLNRKLFTNSKKGKPSGEGVSRVTCSKRQVAIGMPVASAPYYTKNVFSRPIGSRGWETNEGLYATAKVLCVAKRSMRAVKTISRSAPFEQGATNTKVSATCKGGRVPISWGFESDHMPENQAIGATQWVAAPLISNAAPYGRKGWSLTFFTPDGRPAAKQGRVSIHVTCAKLR